MRGLSAQMREYTAELRALDKSSLNDVNTTLSELNPAQLDPRSMIRQAVAEEMQLWLNETTNNPSRPSQNPKEDSHDA